MSSGEFKPVVKVFSSASELANEAAEYVVQVMMQAASSTGHRPSIALSGGSSPRQMYQIFGARWAAQAATVPIDFFLGDERMVPLDDDASNGAMAVEALSSAMGKPPAGEIHLVDTAVSAKESASKYASVLHQHLPCKELPNGVRVPVLDLVLLGVGPDGHTASLFPGTAASTNFTDTVTSSFPPEGTTPNVERVTITPVVIQHARNVMLLTTGEAKRWVIDGILSEAAPIRSPVARLLRQCQGRVFFFLDTSAVPLPAEGA